MCKQSKNPPKDAQGALEAAAGHNPRAAIPVVGCTYLDDATLTHRQRERFKGILAL